MKSDRIYGFIQELKRRRVFRGIVVSGASTLVLLEAATNLANVFGRDKLPLWIVILLGLGFLVSLWFSWTYDFTPGGIRKTEPESVEKVPIPKKEIRTYQTTTFVSVLIIIGLVTYNIIDNAKAKQIRALDKSIAVLPFDDPELSPSQVRTYEFIGREITSCLVKVKDYKIIPWEDCRSFQRRNRTYSDIGYDLGVSLVVEWKIYNIEEAQQLSIDLISVDDERLRWSQSFPVNGNWALAICRISRKISKRITRELRTYLTPQERALINEQETSAVASLYSAMGKAYTQDAWVISETGGMEDNGSKNAFTDSISFSIAIKYFTDAIREDPEFAEAYANRAKAKLMGIRAGFYDLTVLNECLEDIEKASDLNPDLPEAHVAMGFYYYFGLEHYSLAAVSFERACDLSPSNTEYEFYLSKIHCTLGDWREAQVLSNRVLEANPQNALYYTNLGLTYACLDEYSKALHCQDRAIDLMPRWTAPYINKAYTQAYRGENQNARSTVLEAEIQTANPFPRLLAELDLYDGDYTGAASHIEQMNNAELKYLQESEGDACLIQAKIYNHAGSTGLAERYYSQAAEYFSDQINLHPENPYDCSKLGLAYAGLGKDKLAVETAQKAYELGMQHYSAMDFTFVLYNLVLTYTLSDHYQDALDTLQELLDSHSLYTLDFIKTDPDLKPLLSDPGFNDFNL